MIRVATFDGPGTAPVIREVERPHEKLDVWKRAMDIVEDVYKITCRFPIEERFGLITQMRRAAVGVQLQIAKRPGFAPCAGTLPESIDHTFLKLNALIKSIGANRAQ